MSELAFKYYVKSLEIDEQNENNNGIYSSAIKLAEMTSRKYPEKAEVYYQKAVKSANLLNESIYKLTAYIEYGDFFMNHKNIKMALKYYLLALNLTDDNKELEQKVHVRLNDLKIRLGSQFEEIKQDIENEK